MYTTHFGLRDVPFRATPEPRFFYGNAAYREAYATLLYGVLQRKGFVALTGEVGTGKTTLLRRLMAQLGSSVRFVLFYNTTLSFDETVEFICSELELPVEGLSRVQRLQRLNHLLLEEARQGRTVVLLLDEAQNLGPDVLENLRLISNLETATEKLLQIVLVGQPELEVKLADPALRQVAQRIAVRYRLQPLGDDEVEAFVDYRIRQCGRRASDLFSRGALRGIAVYSRGIPRRINILCDAALVATYGAGMKRATAAIVDEVACTLSPPPGRREGARLAAPSRVHARNGGDHPSPAGRRFGWLVAGAALSVGAVVLGLLSGWRTGAGLAGQPQARPEIVASGAPPGPPVSPARWVLVTAPDAEVVAPRGADDGWPAVVPEGTNLSELVWRTHGAQHLLGLDLVQELNPQLADLDRVSPGQQFWMPALTVNTLARRQVDGSYRMTVASLVTPEAANRLAERLRERGYTVRVAPRELGPTRRVHRVVVERLPGLEAASQTWKTAQRLGRTTAQPAR
jgi:type II secretory pathway predicted ATPase ExeA